MFKVNIKINGKNVPSYFHEGDNYIEGRKGSEYTIEFIRPRVKHRASAR